ncbi:calmodulin-like protein 6 [Trifolium pratense]|uniref:calmodulin-like protein 6 n=1 Tax=Trifolium pratense TaxID=57577 RepID=UPI001E692E4A|nr:calmodulin-like protein 6 [Trifolium pratense]
MVFATLLLVVLFIAGLINIVFYIPTNKIRSLLQKIFPNNNINNAPKSNLVTTTKLDKDANFRKEELKKVFSTFDKNGDGFITKQDLKESLRNIRIFMNEKEIDDIVVKFDSNGDGLIDFEEFCLLTSESLGGGEEKKEGVVGSKEDELEELEANLKEAFEVFDKDKDGLISVEELALVLGSLGLRDGNKINEECKEMIRKVDVDGDGMVNFNEFKRMMMNKGGRLV